MYGCKCFYWSKISNSSEPEPEYFSLPDSIPQWPQGSGFSNGIINLGELEVCQVSRFEFIWGRDISTDGKQGASFYKPIGIPNGFFSLGHHCHSNKKPFREFVLAARIATNTKTQSTSIHSSSPLSNPVDYSLVWSSDDGGNESFDKNGYFWLPQSPERYKALGFLVTNKPEKPNLDEVKCVRSDLTDTCKTYRVILKTNSNFLKVPLLVWNTRPLHRGIFGRGVSSGTFLASSDCSLEDELNIACLKNLDNSLHAMPNVDQIHALIRHYGPTVFFHPDEVYLPSSVSWFFRNGAMLYNNNESESSEENIATDGSNLPNGETNDGKYWIDLPMDRQREEYVKHGNIESAKLYVHIKPALGGTFTDIVMWVFCPFNGPANLKVGMVNIALSKIGQHVGDWEHFTLRISNFTGELCSIYFSQHSGGVWIYIFDLEFIEGNKAIVYSSKHGHASFPHPGNHIQGSSKLGIGIRNDAARSDYYIDSSEKYEIIAAEYLGHGVVDEPCWLQYMREWGPTVLYDSRTDIEKVIRVLPVMLQFSVDNIFNKLPVELCKEEGPTGPKEKNNWFGDERW